MRLGLSLEVLLVLGVTYCNSATTQPPTTPPTTKTTPSSTTTTTTTTTTTKEGNLTSTSAKYNLNISTTQQPVEITTENTSSQKESDDFQHIIKHNQLFTEFISFAINPVKTTDVVLDKIKGTLMTDESSQHEIRENKENATSNVKVTPVPANTTQINVKATSLGANATTSNNETPADINGTSSASDFVTTAIKSNEGLQQLFVELMKRSSPGFIVSFDYLEVKKKSLGMEESSRKPVRVWGIVPDEMANKTVYFLADPYRLQSTETDMKETPQEQIDDFECWKNETLYRLGSDDDDKLGDGTIGSLLGIG